MTDEKEKRLAVARERGILVDPQDEWLLEEYMWHTSPDGYPKTTLPADETGRRQMVFLHHAIMGQPIWDDDEIDHISRDQLDGHRCNLRYVTRSVNRINTSREPGISGARNVSMMGGRYQVRIRRNGEITFLGVFDTLEEAVTVRNQWLAQHGG